MEWLPVAALNENLVTVAEDEGAKAVPLRLEYPSFTGWQLTNSLCEHWEDRRIDSEVHVPDGLKMSVQSWIHNRYRVAGGRNCAVARLESQKAARLLDARVWRVQDVVARDFRISLAHRHPPFIPGEKIEVRVAPEP